LVSGSNDGSLDEFGVRDLWVLRYHGGELDDGVAETVGSRDLLKAHISEKFNNGELVKDKDVVIWYGAHFIHDQLNNPGANSIVGPDIRPLK
jgi:hypothetical protein